MPYIGRSSNFGVRTRFLYTATASQTTFSGTDTQNLTLSYSDSNFIDVHQNGVLLKVVDDYTATSGTSVVLATGATASDVIEITVYDVFSIANHIKKTGDAMAGALTNIDIDGTELILDADGDTSITADTDDQIDIKTGGSDRVVIDSSGNLMVSKTSVAASSVGFEARANGFNAFTRDGGQPLEIRRLTDDGQLIDFRRDSTSVGSISAVSSDLAIFSSASSHTGLRLANGYIAPTNNSGTISDNTADLGISNYRFKNLYLSGGLYVGGTGSANFFDDYEEGIHDAVATTTDDTSTALGTGSEDALQYVKIGSMVYIHGSIAVGGASATGAIRVSLPFAPTSLSERADVSYFNVTLDAGDGGGGAAQVGQFIGEVNGAVGAEIRVYATDQLSFQSDSAQSMDASCSLGIMGFYYSS